MNTYLLLNSFLFLLLIIGLIGGDNLFEYIENKLQDKPVATYTASRPKENDKE